MTAGLNAAARKIPLPTPKNVYLRILCATGGIRTEYPTVVLSYLNAKTTPPNPDFLCDIQAFATNFEADPEAKESDFEFVAYVTPRDELMDFSDGHYLKCKVDTMPSNDFFKKVEAAGRYAVIINTEFYTYRALVDDESGEILEAMTEHRVLQ